MTAVILTDCDGVLLDWCGGYRKALRESLGPTRVSLDYSLSTENCVEWVRDAYGVDANASVRLVNDFQVSPEFGRLHPFPDASEWLPRISCDFGIRFKIISSAGLRPDTFELRRQNLGCFGQIFEELLLVEAGHSKRSALLAQPPSLWFDDTPHHVRAGVESGHHSFHFDRSGETVPDMPGRVRSWESVHAWLRTSPPDTWANLACSTG